MGAPSAVLEGGAFSSAPLDSASLQIHCIDPRQSCFVFRVKRETAPDLPPGSAHGIIRHWKEGLARRSAWRGLSPSRQATYSNHLTIGTNVLEWVCYASAICLRLPPYGLPPRGPSNSFTIFTPHSATLLLTTHARNSSNSGLCFQDLAHSFIFRIQQVLCLPLLTRTAGVDTNNSQLGTNLSPLAINFRLSTASLSPLPT